MKNLFESAASKNELLNFALGRNEYFMPERDYGDHSVINSWICHILPLIETKGYEFINEKIKEMFKAILNDKSLNSALKNEIILYHLHVYYYLASENRIKAQNLKELNSKILDSLNLYVNELIQNNKPKAEIISNSINLIKSRGGLLN